MNNIFRISGVILLILSIFLIHSCKKKEKLPSIETLSITEITTNSAKSGGNIYSDGGEQVVSRGIVWSNNQNPTLQTHTGITVDGSDVGAFTSNLTGLTPNTLYFLRAYGSNSIGTGYGNEVSFTTSSVTLSILTTTAITSVTSTTAVSGGNITNNGGGEITAKGVCWNTSNNPTITNFKTTDGTGLGSFLSNLINLQPGTIYYLKAYASNSAGTAYGNELSFKTNPSIPLLSTKDISIINASSINSGGTIISDQGSPITAKGVCWSTNANPTISGQNTIDGSGIGSFNSLISGLQVYTQYYIRAYATNDIGTGYGNQVIFYTVQNNQVADFDGNIYNTVTIGKQIWMKENLKTTKFNDGTSISYVPDNALWIALKTPDYCWYDNEIGYIGIYGAMYNWYVVDKNINGNKNVCPVDWHVPSTTEWQTLIDFLGGESLAVSNKLRETGTIHWSSPNTGATNESGFTALPGGRRDNYGNYAGIHNGANWWSTLEWDNDNAWMMIIGTGVGLQGNYKILGNYIRCIKD